MLKLQNIVKNYVVGDTHVEALKGVSLTFRKSEFVSILGPSGCGKTTMLNIIGGLDQYTSGDLSINGKSTKKFKDSDWDTYRNHSIGFVFQSYNLIPHQSVLANVELALTLSGVSKAERRRRAKEALENVGLGDQIHKRPNQLSGGQMQRVAIARALVNDPEILLADEPTGALDSETSIQIMDILKNISKNKLIIMVTHNPELAEQYSSRIIRLLDGKIISDSDPYENTEIREEETKKKAGRAKKEKGTSMSFFTALSLSLNNLMTKKTRTFMTAFAGSIGIIGIALILSLSSGVNAYINRVEEETLSNYPLTIEQTTVDMSSMMISMMSKAQNSSSHELDKIYSNDIMNEMISTMVAEVSSNDLSAFKTYIESEESGMADLVSDIMYAYGITMNIYSADTSEKIVQVNPSTVLQDMGMPGMENMTAMQNSGSAMMSQYSNVNVFQQLIGNNELLNQQYDVIAGRMPEAYNETVLIVDANNEVSDYTLYALGLRSTEELQEIFKAVQNGEEVPTNASSYTYDELLNHRFKLVLNTDYYEKDESGWIYKGDDDAFMRTVIDAAPELNIVGILRPGEDAASTSAATSGMVGYTAALTEYLINAINDSEIVKAQEENPDVDVFTGIAFEKDEEKKTYTIADIEAYIQTLPEADRMTAVGSIAQMREMGMSDERIAEMFAASIQTPTTDATYESNLNILGVVDLDVPNMINIYPKDFESKDQITDIIRDYNTRMEENGEEEKAIQYTDYIGILLSSVTTIINAISYILIAFVAISLVVSSIMIGIITYISVLERTKEIGILRAIGASKKDISRVFNAETLIVGFTAGFIGIVVTILLNIPINIIIKHLTDISGLSSLPTAGAVILVLISMILTFISGLIPSGIAAKKDPVIALRSE